MLEPLTWAEINSRALLHNLRQFRQRIGKKTKIMAVVKANAYGHGIKEVAEVVVSKIDWFGVNSLEEGISLRKAGITRPILVLGYIPLASINKAIENDLSLVVYHPKNIAKAVKEGKKLKKKAKVHLKIETGTNRQGIALKELSHLIKFNRQKEGVTIEGIHTHFANIEDTVDPSFAQEQLQKFKEALKLLGEEGARVPFKHTACTAAAILFKETYFNLIRLGIGLYGLWPSRETKISAKEKRAKINLKPVLTWKTKVAQVKEVAKGETVGYGRTFTAGRKTRIAVLPVGYWDGYDRGLSNQGRVLMRGQSASVVGRICMNMMMVDVTDIPKVKPEDEVVLLGKQGRQEITAEEIAQKIGTINYEVVTRINPLIPRKVV